MALDRLLNRIEVLEIVPLSYPTIWLRMRAGTFPRSVQIGEGQFGRVAWWESEIEEWLKTRPRTVLKGDKPPKEKGTKPRVRIRQVGK